MNKFLVFPCTVKDNKEGYNGHVVPLVCASSTGFAIFFPISDENAKIINKLLEKPINKEELDLNTSNILSIYKTMVDSWNSGGKYLSGIYMDMEIDPNDKTEIISVKSIISTNHGGYVDNVIKMNFIHAIIIAAMYRFEIVISKELIEKLMPNLDNENEDENTDVEDNELKDPPSALSKKIGKNNKFPKDSQILKIAKKIMNGKIK